MHRSGPSRYLDASWRQSMALAERIVWIEDALDSLLVAPVCDASSQAQRPLRRSSSMRSVTDPCAELVQALEQEALSYRAYYRSSLEHWLSGNRDECYPLDVARLSTLSPDHWSTLQRVLAVEPQRPAPLLRAANSRRRQN